MDNPGAHQWLLAPGTIAIRPRAKPTLCLELKCPLAATYDVQYPAQTPIPYCKKHTQENIDRATGQKQNLRKMLAATRERDQHPQRSRRYHVHWPDMGWTDEEMAALGIPATIRMERTRCGRYVPVRHIARTFDDITCPVCRKKVRTGR